MPSRIILTAGFAHQRCLGLASIGWLVVAPAVFLPRILDNLVERLPPDVRGNEHLGAGAFTFESANEHDREDGSKIRAVDRGE